MCIQNRHLDRLTIFWHFHLFVKWISRDAIDIWRSGKCILDLFLTGFIKNMFSSWLKRTSVVFVLEKPTLQIRANYRSFPPPPPKKMLVCWHKSWHLTRLFLNKSHNFDINRVYIMCEYCLQLTQCIIGRQRLNLRFWFKNKWIKNNKKTCLLKLTVKKQNVFAH